MRTLVEDEVIDTHGTEQQTRIRRQLERILAHSSFKNSRRYQSFLRYVVEESLNGNAVYLKERMIGIAVFNQAVDYDTNSNSVVRVTAGEVRRRLAQYYLNATQEDEVVIELPVGSYLPEFRAHDITVPPEGKLSIPEVSFPYGAAPVRSEVLAAAEIPNPTPARKWNRPFAATVAGCCLIAAVVFAVLLVRGAGVTEVDRIWKSAFGGQDVLLCAGPLGAEGKLGRGQDSDPLAQSFNTGISFTIAKTIGIIGSAIGRTGGHTFLLPMQDTKLEDLQRSPAVLVGAFNNEWTMRLQAPLRYQFFRTPQYSPGIVDTKNPASKRFMVTDQPTRDYGILAHFHSPTTGQPTVIVGGLGMHGTAAVRIFLSSPELLREFSKTAPRGWEGRNYEIVLASDLVNNLADSPKVVAVYFW
jgi:hypothetical protein